MLLKYHKDYTIEVLNKLSIPNKIGEEILIGSTANDLCEFTNEAQLFIWNKKVLHKLFGAKKKVLGASALWQSHFGNLASMHSMSKSSGEEPVVVRNELADWFEFLNGVALDQIDIDPDSEIRSDSVPIKKMFEDHSIEYDQIFDTEKGSEIRNRATGMMLHLIQDIFTKSHCERNDNGEIVKFYFYGLQDKDKHEKGDDVSELHKDEMLVECENCVSSILNGKPYDFSQIVLLAEDTQTSDGGPFV